MLEYCSRWGSLGSRQACQLEQEAESSYLEPQSQNEERELAPPAEHQVFKCSFKPLYSGESWHEKERCVRVVAKGEPIVCVHIRLTGSLVWFGFCLVHGG